jgi:hypothetical protein
MYDHANDLAKNLICNMSYFLQKENLSSSPPIPIRLTHTTISAALLLGSSDTSSQ